MGTPDFAVESLKVLVEAGYELVAVITAPDKPSGRGKKIQQSPVKTYALSQNIPVLQPPRLKNPEFLETLKGYNADLQIVVAFRMLPELVWAMPKFGTFNLHGSLLPQYRGAAPINWAVINGETETGVTTFFIEKEIDTGKIIFKEKLAINDDDNAGTIHDKLMVIGANLVLKTVKAIENNDYPQTEQEEFEALKPAPKIFKEDCLIDWSKNSKQIFDFIRGLSPYPGAWTKFENTKNGEVGNLKIFDSQIIDTNSTSTSGEIFTDNKTYLHIGTMDGLIAILNLQIPGKKRLGIEDLLRGYDAEQIKIC
ncbi:methionyl-tRNA formyltransferase [Arcticibacterium luteifluviistationis]|uniref:Methionyl-tRNA formyltransferase n=2 Tax=Arcticibacterium luteifluviistationis TaxID=1784714 RepID=A0A2Z4GIN1_9BACT|nr:methionyl-tRNA formyltransferase [Arcticibacterium luteifluviistationis]